MKVLSLQTLDEGTTNGEGIASANGAFLLPDRDSSSAIPVLVAEYPIFFNR